MRGVGDALGRLRREALVAVVVALQHHVDAAVVERLHDRLDLRERRVLGVRREVRLMPVGDRAQARMRGEIGLDPVEQRRRRAVRRVDIAGVVDRDEVPGAPVEAVGGVVGERDGRLVAVRAAAVPVRQRIATPVLIMERREDRVDLGDERAPVLVEVGVVVRERAALVLVVAEAEDEVGARGGRRGTRRVARRGRRMDVADGGDVQVGRRRCRGRDRRHHRWGRRSERAATGRAREEPAAGRRVREASGSAEPRRSPVAPSRAPACGTPRGSRRRPRDPRAP